MRKKNIIVKISDAAEFFIILIIFILFYLTRPIETNRVIFIPKGSINYTIKSLKKNISLNFLDKMVLIVLGNPQYGWIDLKSNIITRLDFLNRLTTSKAAFSKITIIPGETTYFVYKQIEKKLKVSNIKCSFKEGFLRPDTYFLPIGMNKAQLCNFLEKISRKYHSHIMQTIFGKVDFDRYYRYLIVASIIQKETYNRKEMKLIASVIYNRLKKGIKLQMDGTLNYGKYSHVIVTPQRIIDDNTKFNTYKFYGLPPTAVAIPSKEAIMAAIFPAKSDYLYFVKCGKGHVFAKTYKEHLKNIYRCK